MYRVVLVRSGESLRHNRCLLLRLHVSLPREE